MEKTKELKNGLTQPEFSVAVFDIEANNLYHGVTKGHCMVIIDAFTNEVFKYRPDQMKEGFAKLLTFGAIVGHNIIDYDLPALVKLYGGSFTGMKVHDTIVASRTYMPDRFGGHSLDAWGKRLKVYKGDYGKQDNAWEVFTEAMLLYCVDDVLLNVALFHHLAEKELGGYFFSTY